MPIQFRWQIYRPLLKKTFWILHFCTSFILIPVIGSSHLSKIMRWSYPIYVKTLPRYSEPAWYWHLQFLIRILDFVSLADGHTKCLLATNGYPTFSRFLLQPHLGGPLAFNVVQPSTQWLIYIVLITNLIFADIFLRTYLYIYM